MKNLKWALIIGIIFLISCGSEGEFNFSQNWTWKELKNQTSNDTTISKINNLKDHLSLEKAQSLLTYISNLKDPKTIRELYTLEEKQTGKGGDFVNYIPKLSQGKNEIPIPNNFRNKIKTALYLAKYSTNVEVSISRPRFNYNTEFNNNSLLNSDSKKYDFQSDLELNINTSTLQNLLNRFKEGTIPQEEANDFAQDKMFDHMINCRNNIPQLTSQNFSNQNLAYFIHTTSREEPIYQIWNLINPWNNFSFADLYNNKDEYINLLDEIDSNKKLLKNKALKRVDRFIPKNSQYQDSLFFSLNLGVLSWSNDQGIGINTVHVKDDLESMQKAIRREVIHSLKFKIFPLHPTRKNKENLTRKDLYYWDFDEKSDRIFYELLANIYIEGLALYIGGSPSNWTYADGVKDCKDLLEQAHYSLYESNNYKQIDVVRKWGNKPQGPFASMGYFMAKNIHQDHGNEEIRKAIKKGPIYFFKNYYLNRKADSGGTKFIDEKVGQKIVELSQKMDTYTNK